MAVPTKKRATVADLIAIEDCDRLEIIGGEIVQKAMPSWRHARAETKYGEILAPFNRKAGGPRGPGGWWIATEVHVGYGDEIYCHDIAGWQRHRVAKMPDSSLSRSALTGSARSCLRTTRSRTSSRSPG